MSWNWLFSETETILLHILNINHQHLLSFKVNFFHLRLVSYFYVKHCGCEKEDLNCKIWYKSAVKHFKYMSRELQETLRQRQYLKGLKLMTLSWLNTTRKNRIWAVLRQLPRTFQRLIVDIWIFLGITWTFTIAS